ncbi:TroA family protein [Klebsiella variicola]|uniref:hypothetical protein n=2 Tax=Klebsiella TaxID=570 RepID=UPI00164A2E55|nr:hypothetical protein [Klebsiella variicola]MCB3051640.1 hypothetical protein [Klebsiella pneumoniae]HBM2960883.1 hypothetical protein [Klebsiella michiganensis]HCI4635003.1 hypothetical protein [Klebsiella quasipneumoniae subsp. quasipneumoniae]MBC4751628.1 hypothetical protein [Klebsiella variicola]HBT1577750.1 hypothetical protein [Klebsiella pneumoniae]
MMKKFALFALLSLPFSASAIVMGGSNLGFSGYPEFSEIAPTPPYSDDQYAWDSYRREVADYAEKAKQYLEDSNSDMKRIQEAQQDAIQKANDVVEEFNRKAKGY